MKLLLSRPSLTVWYCTVRAVLYHQDESQRHRQRVSAGLLPSSRLEKCLRRLEQRKQFQRDDTGGKRRRHIGKTRFIFYFYFHFLVLFDAPFCFEPRFGRALRRLFRACILSAEQPLFSCFFFNFAVEQDGAVLYSTSEKESGFLLPSCVSQRCGVGDRVHP